MSRLNAVMSSNAAAASSPSSSSSSIAPCDRVHDMRRSARVDVQALSSCSPLQHSSSMQRIMHHILSDKNLRAKCHIESSPSTSPPTSTLNSPVPSVRSSHISSPLSSARSSHARLPLPSSHRHASTRRLHHAQETHDKRHHDQQQHGHVLPPLTGIKSPQFDGISSTSTLSASTSSTIMFPSLSARSLTSSHNASHITSNASLSARAPSSSPSSSPLVQLSPVASHSHSHSHSHSSSSSPPHVDPQLSPSASQSNSLQTLPFSPRRSLSSSPSARGHRPEFSPPHASLFPDLAPLGIVLHSLDELDSQLFHLHAQRQAHVTLSPAIKRLLTSSLPFENQIRLEYSLLYARRGLFPPNSHVRIGPHGEVKPLLDKTHPNYLIAQRQLREKEKMKEAKYHLPLSSSPGTRHSHSNSGTNSSQPSPTNLLHHQHSVGSSSHMLANVDSAQPSPIQLLKRTASTSSTSSSRELLNRKIKSIQEMPASSSSSSAPSSDPPTPNSSSPDPTFTMPPTYTFPRERPSPIKLHPRSVAISASLDSTQVDATNHKQRANSSSPQPANLTRSHSNSHSNNTSATVNHQHPQERTQSPPASQKPVPHRQQSQALASAAPPLSSSSSSSSNNNPLSPTRARSLPVNIAPFPSLESLSPVSQHRAQPSQQSNMNKNMSDRHEQVNDSEQQSTNDNIESQQQPQQQIEQKSNEYASSDNDATLSHPTSPPPLSQSSSTLSLLLPSSDSAHPTSHSPSDSVSQSIELVPNTTSPPPPPPLTIVPIPTVEPKLLDYTAFYHASESWSDALKRRGGHLSHDDNQLLRDMHISQMTPWISNQNLQARMEEYERELTNNMGLVITDALQSTFLRRRSLTAASQQLLSHITEGEEEFRDQWQQARVECQTERDDVFAAHSEEFAKIEQAYNRELEEVKQQAEQARLAKIEERRQQWLEEDRERRLHEEMERENFDRLHFEELQRKQALELERRAKLAEQARLERERRRQQELEMEAAYLAYLKRQEELLLIKKWNDKRRIARRGILTMRIIRCTNLPPIHTKYEYRFGFQLRFNAANLPNSITVYTPFFQTDQFESGCIFNQEFKFEVNNAALQKVCVVLEKVLTSEIDKKSNRDIAIANSQRSGIISLQPTNLMQAINLEKHSSSFGSQGHMNEGDGNNKGQFQFNLGIQPQYAGTKYGGCFHIPVVTIRGQEGGILHNTFGIPNPMTSPTHGDRQCKIELEFRLQPIFVQTKGGGGMAVLETMEQIEADLNKQWDPYLQQWNRAWQAEEEVKPIEPPAESNADDEGPQEKLAINIVPNVATCDTPPPAPAAELPPFLANFLQKFSNPSQPSSKRSSMIVASSRSNSPTTRSVTTSRRGSMDFSSMDVVVDPNEHKFTPFEWNRTPTPTQSKQEDGNREKERERMRGRSSEKDLTSPSSNTSSKSSLSSFRHSSSNAGLVVEIKTSGRSGYVEAAAGALKPEKLKDGRVTSKSPSPSPPSPSPPSPAPPANKSSRPTPFWSRSSTTPAASPSLPDHHPSFSRSSTIIEAEMVPWNALDTPINTKVKFDFAKAFTPRSNNKQQEEKKEEKKDDKKASDNNSLSSPSDKTDSKKKKKLKSNLKKSLDVSSSASLNPSAAASTTPSSRSSPLPPDVSEPSSSDVSTPLVPSHVRSMSDMDVTNLPSMQIITQSPMHVRSSSMPLERKIFQSPYAISVNTDTERVKDDDDDSTNAAEELKALIGQLSPSSQVSYPLTSLSPTSAAAASPFSPHALPSITLPALSPVARGAKNAKTTKKEHAADDKAKDNDASDEDGDEEDFFGFAHAHTSTSIDNN